MSYGATRAKGWPALRYLVEVRVVGDMVQPEDGEEGEEVEGDQDSDAHVFKGVVIALTDPVFVADRAVK